MLSQDKSISKQVNSSDIQITESAGMMMYPSVHFPEEANLHLKKYRGLKLPNNPMADHILVEPPPTRIDSIHYMVPFKVKHIKDITDTMRIKR